MIDEQLKQYATDRQWEYYLALKEHGTGRKASRALGVNHNAVNKAVKSLKRAAARYGYSPKHDLTEGLPEGQFLKGVSTYYGQDGEVKGRWIKGQADAAQQEEILKAAREAFAAELPREKGVAPPKAASDSLMACYPVGDQHLGMLAWDEETGANYDTKVAEKLLKGAMDHLIPLAPACEEATIVFLGDFMHYDSFEPVTPRSRNQLDTDTRFPKVVCAAIKSMRYLIYRALTRHQHVRVIVEIGNHDPVSSVFLRECLANIYENEPRISVDTSPTHYHYFTFGNSLVGTHHGHAMKVKDLPLIMAADKPVEWGASKFRYWWTGHIHRDTLQDIHGTKVESFRILATSDAWAHQEGFRPMQDMKCIILHKDYGEVSRHTVNPEMLIK